MSTSDHPLQNAGLAIVLAGPLLASIVVGLRLYARRRGGIRLGWDDYLIVTAAALSLALIYPSVRFMVMWHIGWHIWQVPSRSVEPDFHELWQVTLAFNAINTPILPLVKASILALLLKIAWIIKPLRYMLVVFLVFVIISFIGPEIAFLFLCPQGTANTSLPSAYPGIACLDRHQGGVIMVAVAAANMLTDVLIFPIPILVMRELKNASWKSRISVILSFALMFGATGIGAARLEQTYRSQLYVRQSDILDWTYQINFTMQHAENNVAIILACIPMLRSLVMGWTSKNANDEGSRQTPRESTIFNPMVPGESILHLTCRTLRGNDDEMPKGKELDELGSRAESTSTIGMAV